MKYLLILLAAISGFAFTPRDDGRGQRSEYISPFIKEGAVGAEIGVDEGIFSYYVLLPKAPKKLYLIDPWEFGLEPWETEPTPERLLEKETKCRNVYECFAPFENVEILRMKSEDAVDLFEDDTFDYVYIDGEHSYKSVMHELTAYFPKVKIGGLILGDDYGWTGVAPAVQDFLKLHEGECLFIGDPCQERSVGQYVIRRLK